MSKGGRFLHDREFTSLTGSAALDMLIRRINLLPRRLRERFYAVSGAIEALPQRRVPRLDMDRIAAWLAGLYPDRRYDAVFTWRRPAPAAGGWSRSASTIRKR